MEVLTKKNNITKVELYNNIFYYGDVLEVLKEIESNIIDLVFTSPPYNVGIKYENWNDNLKYNDYLEFLRKVIQELYRVIKDDGRLAINVPSITAEGEYKPLFNDIINICSSIGFKMRQDIIWFKHQVSKRTAWGSFGSPSSPYLVQPYEFILIFDKKNKKHQGKKENIDITKEEFIKFSISFWDIKPETRKDILENCPVPFPEELAYRIIKLYTYKNDIVLDCFGGSGTTSFVATKLNRKAIYIDNSFKSFQFAIKRVQNLFKFPSLFNK
jgi:DNA modification methylase